MRYRARCLRTNVCIYPEETYAQDTGEPAREWVLEYEIVEGEWVLSACHRRDITGVQDPRTFSEIKSILEEAVK